MRHCLCLAVGRRACSSSPSFSHLLVQSLAVAGDHHVWPDGVAGHQPVLHIGICLHKCLDVLLAHIPAAAASSTGPAAALSRSGRDSTGPSRCCTRRRLEAVDMLASGSPEDEDGAVHGVCQGTRHHKLVLLRLQHPWQHHPV